MSFQLTSLFVLAAIACIDIVSGAPSTVHDPTGPDGHFLSQIINKKYPLTDPEHLPDGSIKYRIGIISDLDADSKSKDEPYTWFSYLKQGYLVYDPVARNVSITWDPSTNGRKYKTNFSMNGRGSELSELVTYNGQLVAVDDKTGLVYIIEGKILIPWVIVVEGDGRQRRGIKGEWATVKDSELYVGTHGKELVSQNGTVVDPVNMWVKVIDKAGAVRHLNWTDNYLKVREAFGIHFPGYMTHESCVWSDMHGKWFFLPRKASVEPFDHKADERKATNVLLAATPDFLDIQVVRVGEIVPNHGYSSFRFIPGTNDTIITAIKSQEEGDVTATFITAFDIDGTIIYPEKKVSDLKFEGFEFI